jgi:hypothetical protein
MLTKTQLDMIRERKEKGEQIDPQRKKYIDFTLRNYIKKQLNNLIEIYEVLDVLPRNQIREVIIAKHIIGILKLLGKISSICLAPIEYSDGNPYAVYRFKLVTKLPRPIKGKDRIESIMKYSFPAEPWEVELAKELGPYMQILNNLFTNEYDNKGYTMEEWNEFGAIRLQEIITRRGQSFELHMIEESSAVGVEKIHVDNQPPK